MPESLEQYIAGFRRLASYELLVAVVYVGVSAPRVGVVLAWGTEGPILLAMTACMVLMWLADAVLACSFASMVRSTAEGPSVRAECVATLIRWKRACVAVSCVGVCFYLVRFALMMRQLCGRRDIGGMYLAVLHIVAILAVKLLRIFAFSSFANRLRLQEACTSV